MTIRKISEAFPSTTKVESFVLGSHITSSPIKLESRMTFCGIQFYGLLLLPDSQLKVSSLAL